MRKVGRNELCPCGSKRKYKHCCWERMNRKDGVIFKETTKKANYYVNKRYLRALAKYE